MRSFFTLAGYEYKKLFSRKSTISSLILVLMIMILLCVTSVTGNSYKHSEGGGTTLLEAMKLDKKVVCSKAGFIDDAFLKEAISQNAHMISNDENYLVNDYGRFLKNKAYIDYALPYEKVAMIINAMYEPDLSNLSTDGSQIFNLNGIKPIDTMTNLSEKDFYEKIRQTISETINRRPSLSESEREKHMQMLLQVKTPFYNDYYRAYSQFSQDLQVLALILFVAIAVCISPIFAGEYQLKTDQILLSSKYGKNKAIFAKLFTGTTFAFTLTVVMLFGVFTAFLAIHGFSGFDMAMQTLDIFSTYPLTVIQAVLIAIAVTIIVTLFFSMLTMLLSSWFKSPFSAVTVSFLIIFMPALIFVSPQNRLLYQLLQIFPAKATTFSNIFSDYFFEILGVIFTPAMFYIVFLMIASVTIIPFVYRNFKNHQIE